MAGISAVSKTNSTVATLESGETFAGDFEEISDYASISIISATSGAATLYAEFSTDGTTVARTVQLSISGVDQGIHSLIPVARWFRVRLVNDAGASNTPALQTLYNRSPRIAQPTSRLAQTVNQYSDVQITRDVSSFDFETSRNKLVGLTTLYKFGRVSAVTTTEQVVWEGGTTYDGFLTAASAVRVKAGGNANDDAAGTGARTIVVVGLDQDWAEASETITLAGTSASSATTTTFIRVFRAYVATTGTYTGANIGAVDIETTGGVLLVQISAGNGQSTIAVYTVPAGYTMFVRSIAAVVDGNKNVNVNIWQRQNADTISAPYTAKRLVESLPGISGAIGQESKAWRSFPAKCDFWFTAAALTGTSGVFVEFEAVLVAG